MRFIMFGKYGISFSRDIGFHRIRWRWPFGKKSLYLKDALFLEIGHEFRIIFGPSRLTVDSVTSWLLYKLSADFRSTSCLEWDWSRSIFPKLKSLQLGNAPKWNSASKRKNVRGTWLSDHTRMGKYENAKCPIFLQIATIFDPKLAINLGFVN